MLDNAIGQVNELRRNPVATAIGGAVVGGSLVGAVIASRRKRKTSTRKTRKPKRRTTRRTKKRRSYKYARTAGKRKDTSTKRIRMTKTGQPYIILKSGKARFISKASARASRKRKGGRY